MKHLKSFLEYSPDTGHFTWKAQRSAQTPVGSIAGGKNAEGYICICVKGKTYKAHRLAWFFVHGYFPEFIDHKDRNRSNNVISNLRDATRAQNNANVTKRASNTSGYKGVVDRGTRFEAQITFEGRTRFLGSFPTAEEAHAAYCEKADEFFGEFSHHH